jgi:MinD-like ATPase involved in chromosome partitioning or flagellar assembly
MGATTLAVSTAAILSAVQRTILVDLDTIAAGVAAQLDAGGRGSARRTLVDVMQAAPRSPNDQAGRQLALRQAVRPLPQLSSDAAVIYGVPEPKQRFELAPARIAPLVDALRDAWPLLVLDLGAAPLSGTSPETQVTAAALRAADQVLLVTLPDQASLLHARLTLREADEMVDRERVALVLNRWDGRFHEDPSTIEVKLVLPVVAVLPEDRVAAQRALAAGEPVASERSSKLRKPLLDLLERFVVAGGVTLPSTHPWQARPSPWRRLRAALPTLPAALWGGPS